MSYKEELDITPKTEIKIPLKYIAGILTVVASLVGWSTLLYTGIITEIHQASWKAEQAADRAEQVLKISMSEAQFQHWLDEQRDANSPVYNNLRWMSLPPKQ